MSPDVPPAHHGNASFRFANARETAMVLQAACAARARVVWSTSADQRGTGALTQDGETYCLEADDGSIVSGEGQLEFVTYGLQILLRCALVESQVHGPFVIRNTERRAATRVSPREPLVIEWFSNAAEGLQTHRATILDISATGARSLLVSDSQMPASRPFAATIRTGDELVPCMAEVQSQVETASGIEVRLRLIPAETGRLSEIVLRALFPDVKFRREVAVEKLARLFEASGYLKLRDSCSSPETAAWLSMNADHLTRDIVYVSSDGEALGHVSTTRGYRKTWIAHQTAMRSDHPEAANARQLMRNVALSVALTDGPGGHSVAYYDRTKAYGRMFFERFVEAVANEDVAVIADLHWFERDGTPIADPVVLPASASVSLADTTELAAVTDLARAHLPNLIADALDIHPACLRSSGLHPFYRESELFRTREVLVARSGGWILGAALCEHTSIELNLSHTLNIAQVYFVKPGVDAQLQLALLREIERYYLERGVKDPMIVAPPGLLQAEQLPIKFSRHVGLIGWSFDGARAYENYLLLRCEWLERRARRKALHARENTQKETS